MVLTDISLIEKEILKAGYYIEVELSEKESVPFVVEQNVEFEHLYDFKTQISSWKPLAPYGLTATEYNPSFLQFQKLSLPDFANITDMFALNDNNEMIQAFVGVAPSPVLVYYNLPSNVPYASYDNDTAPDSTYYQFGYQFDGFKSPLHRPHPKSQFLDVRGININFTLGNPVTSSMNPIFNFYINRLSVLPVTDEALGQDIVDGKVPRKTFNMAGIDKAASLNPKYYPGYISLTPHRAGGA